jgi:hypothetical protein
VSLAAAALGACSHAAPAARPASPTSTTTPASSPTPAASVSPTAAPLPAGCRADPRAGVHAPLRLLLLRRCVAVTGRVARVYVTEDGDRHVDLTLDPRFARLVNEFNLRDVGGLLVTETVPADQRGVLTPAVGAHVRVTGPLVIDLAHGWVEVHPVWRIEVLR